MDNTVKNIKNLSLFGIIPLIFAIVFVGIYLERCGFKNQLLRNVFLVLLALLAVLAIIPYALGYKPSAMALPSHQFSAHQGWA